MKSYISVCLFVLAINCLYGQQVMEAPKFSLGLLSHNKELAAGTTVTLECKVALHPEQLRPSQLIPCSTSMAVWSKGTIVIANGAPAMARIKSIMPATFNDPGMLVLEAVNVMAVDGNHVSVWGEHTVMGQHPNESLKSVESTRFSVMVASACTIKT